MCRSVVSVWNDYPSVSSALLLVFFDVFCGYQLVILKHIFCKKSKYLIFLSLVFVMSSETSSPTCLFWFLNYLHLFCIYGHSTHIPMSVRVRGQLDLANLFSPTRGYWDWSQVVMFGGRCLYLLSYLTCPRVFVCLLAYLLACFLRYC